MRWGESGMVWKQDPKDGLEGVESGRVDCVAWRRLERLIQVLVCYFVLAQDGSVKVLSEVDEISSCEIICPISRCFLFAA